jgi:hypothetical protein
MGLILRTTATPNSGNTVVVKNTVLTFAEGDGNLTYLLTHMSGSSVSITGATTITGSLIVTNNISGSLTGTASYALSTGNVVSSSYSLSSSRALTSSYALTALSSSYATTSSYTLNALSASYTLTASRATTASYALTASIPGTQYYVPLWDTANTLNTSTIYQSGTSIGVGTTTPQDKLQVFGDLSLRSGTNINANWAMLKIGTSDPSYLSHYAAIASSGYSSSPAKANLMFYTDGGTGPTEKMRIQGNGNVVINGTTSFYKLDVDAAGSGNTGSAFRLNIDNANTSHYSGFNSHIDLTNDNAVGQNTIVSYINGTLISKIRSSFQGHMNYVVNSGAHIFYTGGDTGTGSAKVYIGNTGNVGIGTTSPDYTLTVDGTVALKNLSAVSQSYIIGYNTSTGQLTAVSTGSIAGTVTNGSYTPTLSTSTNIGTTIFQALNYYRSNNIVTVFGLMRGIAVSSGLSTIDIDLPISSTLGSAYNTNIAGIANAAASSGIIVGNGSGGAQIQINNLSTTAFTYISLYFSYKVI